ncbi:hypothetical protein E1301_Tti006466 [Triplophysa tibetana]|uniref:Uncharacterized protein n=1 Tax=Triplophysa tibetana TaxID=1572043 RepID=A0A5A9NWS0_9TELE|nr:hypothetical protein E1301_Tti006466 [Triplophysa tibetana]
MEVESSGVELSNLNRRLDSNNSCSYLLSEYGTTPKQQTCEAPHKTDIDMSALKLILMYVNETTQMFNVEVSPTTDSPESCVLAFRNPVIPTYVPTGAHAS